MKNIACVHEQEVLLPKSTVRIVYGYEIFLIYTYFLFCPQAQKWWSKMAKIHEIFSSKLQFTTISNFSYLCGCIWEIWVLFQIEILKSVSILKKKDTLVTLDRNCAAMLMLTGSHKRHLKAWAGLFKAELR